MTIQNRVKNVDLRNADSLQRDRLLLDAYSKGSRGLTPETLSRIRDLDGGLYDRVLEGSYIFFEALLELGIPRDSIASQFTSNNLAALVYREWENAKSSSNSVSTAISRHHGDESERKLGIFGFRDLGAMQIFREQIRVGTLDGEVRLYNGNLYEARARWRNFQPSNEDFMKNYCIPTQIGFYEAFLLGVFWADGHISQTRKSKFLSISGNRKDLDFNVDFYGDVVIPLLRGIHNFVEISDSRYIRNKNKKAGDGKSTYPSVDIYSAAISSWLIDDLGFPPPVTKRENTESINLPFDVLLRDEAKYGFFSGLIAAMGTIHAKNGYLRFEDKNKPFVDGISRLASEIGYSPSEVKPDVNSWYIFFKKRDLIDMCNLDIGAITKAYNFAHTGLFFNRKHQNVLQLGYTG